jgi:glutaredoxin
MKNDRGIKMVILYSTSTCPYCMMEKSWLESKKVTHKVILVDQNPKEAQEMVNKTGQMGVPVTEIEYENRTPEYIIGFDQAKLSYYLGVN